MKNGNIYFSRLFRVCLCCIFFWLGSMGMVLGQEVTIEDGSYFEEENDVGMTADPLEPINRAFFHFNDKLYFWVLKPTAQGYGYLLAEDVRMCVRSFFKNILAPVRIVNNLLQGKIMDSGVETARFVINSTLGIAGLADAAKDNLGLDSKDEDFGQTLGTYGVGEGFFVCWPFFGPSNVRDTIGMAGDYFLSPVSYLAMSDPGAGVAVEVGREVNITSLSIGDYEDFKEASIDPYIAMRDAYSQYRQKKIRDLVVGGSSLYVASSGKREKAYARDAAQPVPAAATSNPIVAEDSFIKIETSVEAK